MLILADTESLIEQAKKGTLNTLSGKDKIYCFNENGKMIDISFINIASQIKGNLLIIPGEMDPISAAYIIGSEKADEVKLLTNKETNNLVNQVTLVTAATGAGMSFSNKLKLSKEKERKPREKKIPEATTVDLPEPVIEETPILNKDSEASVIERMCLNSANAELKKIGENKNLVFKLRKAIMESSDYKIGFPLMLGLVMGKEQTNLILKDCEPIYRALRPGAK